MVQTGQFITFEGVDGAGKSTHIQAVCSSLEALGFEVICTREPGGTPVGEALRQILMTQKMPTISELLLMYAARVAHWEDVILPKLKQGCWVVCDRFEDSSFAYQGSTNPHYWQACQILSQLTLQGAKPNFTLLFDLPIQVSLERLRERGEPMDVFEARGLDYFQKVRAGFLQRAKNEPNRIAVIDANRSETEIAIEVQTRLAWFWNAHAS